MDKLAIEEAGIKYCVSVPDGAPSPKRIKKESNDSISEKPIGSDLNGSPTPQVNKSRGQNHLSEFSIYLDHIFSTIFHSFF